MLIFLTANNQYMLFQAENKNLIRAASLDLPC